MATDQGRGIFAVSVCVLCGLVRLAWVPAEKHEGKLDLGGECPEATAEDPATAAVSELDQEVRARLLRVASSGR